MTSPFLCELSHVDKSFTLSSGSEFQVLKDLSLGVYSKDFVVILGPSGAGKSTLLKILCGLLKMDQGELRTQGEILNAAQMNPLCSLVFQSAALFPWDTVFENIALALKPFRLSRTQIQERVQKTIELVGLEGFEEAYPRELSGGMKQKVGLARALVTERPLLLMDEPFSSLDTLTADTLRTEFLELWHEKKMALDSVVLVTHNIQEAVLMAKRILILGRNPASIEHEIEVDLPYPRSEASPLVQRLVSKIYDLLADTLIPDKPTAGVDLPIRAGAAARISPIEAIPDVQISELIGFLEAIGDEGGAVNVFNLAQKTGSDFGSTLYLAKAAELLDLVETPRHSILLTSLGKKFFDADSNTRKEILRDRFSKLNIVQMATNILLKNADFCIYVDELLERVAEWIPYEDPQRVLDVMIAWGRSAEYFGYNDDTKEIYLIQDE